MLEKAARNTLVVMASGFTPLACPAYGHQMANMPHMLRLAGNGVLFENAYTPSPISLPARAAFLAGQRVHETQVINNCTLGLPADLPSYPRELETGRVRTVFFGRSDFHCPLRDTGFDEFHATSEREPPGDTHIGRRPLEIRPDGVKRQTAYGVRHQAHTRDEAAIDQAALWLRKTAPELDQPWHALVCLEAPRFPHFCTAPEWKDVPVNPDPPDHDRLAETALHPYARDLRAHFKTDGFIEPHITGLRRGYLARLEFVDRQVGRLCDALVEHHLTQTTDVLVTSDCGEMIGTFGLWWEGSLLEGAVRIPLVAAGPSFEPGRTIRTPVDLFDLRAQIFHVAQAGQHPESPGTPLCEIPASDEERVVISEYHGPGTRSGAFMVRRGPWKLIYCLEAPHLLFNLEDDPDELDNRCASEYRTAMDLESELRSVCSPEEENHRAHATEDRQAALLRRHTPLRARRSLAG